MNIYTTFLKFTNREGKEEYVSVYIYTQSHPDSFDGEISELLYKKVGEGFGEFVPI
jgi:hypothetical protein